MSSDRSRTDPPETASTPSQEGSDASASGGISRRGFAAVAGAAAAAMASRPREARADASTPIYRIHPAIGVARLGNADPSTFFIGPEVPGYGPLGSAPGTVAPPYKAADGRLKPQGVRFRLFEYQYVNGRLTPVREVNLDTPGVAAITWTVHLANKKSSFYEFAGRQGEESAPAPLRNASVTDRASLENDYGPRSVSGRSQAPVSFTPGPQQVSCVIGADGNPVIPYLGQILTDAEGCLVVLGGKGHSASNQATPPSLDTYANNDGWFDDASDGPVTATVTITQGGKRVDVPVDPTNGGAWVLCTPPDFAPPIGGAVSGYELFFDVGVRSIPIPPENALYDDGMPLARLRQMKADFTPGASAELPTTVADFTEDVQPILLAGYNYWYVDDLVTYKHNSLIDPSLADPSAASAKNRQGVLVYLRPPVGVPLNASATTGNRTMPHLKGDDPYIGSLPDAVRYLSLTHTQYALMVNWANGQFTPPTGAPPPPPAITAHGLDRAVLEACVGGAFFPGIEFGWQIRNPSLFSEPFRLNLNATSGYWGEEGLPIGPGHFTRQMAVPWQADFNDCRNEGDYGWWPSQRPTAVLPSADATQRVEWARATVKFDSGKQVSTHEDMVENWWKFGFVVADADVFVETERAETIP